MARGASKQANPGEIARASEPGAPVVDQASLPATKGLLELKIMQSPTNVICLRLDHAESGLQLGAELEVKEYEKFIRKGSIGGCMGVPVSESRTHIVQRAGTSIGQNRARLGMSCSGT